MGKKKSKKKKETLDNIKPHKKLDSGFYHEYTERAHVGGIVIEDIFTQHSVYEKHPTIRKIVDQILSECADLYQLTAYLMYKKELIEEKADNQEKKKK
jgi:hypothetical protein